MILQALNAQRQQAAREQDARLEPFLREHAQRGTGWLAEQLGLKVWHVRKIMLRLNIARRPKTGPAPGRARFWNGGRIVDADGYVLLYRPEHPHATKGGYVREHRLVLEQSLGRCLLPTEVVHHRNGDKADNRPENLELLSGNGPHIAAYWSGRHHSPETRQKMRQSALQRAQNKHRQGAVQPPDDNP